MAKNENLHKSKDTKNDEFYTRYEDIETEINAYIEYNDEVFKGKTILLPCDDPEWSNFTKYFAANFERLGLKKIISTSYAKSAGSKQLTSFEKSSPNFDKDKHKNNGKLFVLDKGIDSSVTVNSKDIKFTYLEGDGDFRSDEVKKLRDEADIIITNPPFSLFRDFLAWIFEADKKFIIIGNQNAITYKEVFPLIKDNKLWLGNGFTGGNAYFKPLNIREDDYADGVFDSNTGLVKFRNCCWFTNIDHGKRHQEMPLMTMVENLKFNKKFTNKIQSEYGSKTYPKYDNYNAIEVPFSNAIPSDYDGAMGVPISFLDKYNPEQFEIVGWSRHNDLNMDGGYWTGGKADATVNDKIVYRRILIKRKEKKSDDENNA